MAAWATKVQARAHWKDAVPLDDAVLDTLLNASTISCRSYAPKLRRIITDAVTTNTSTTLTAASGAFDDILDIGAVLSGTGLGGSVLDVISNSKVVMSQAATATGTGVEVTINRIINENYMLACVYQARDIFAASVRGESDVVGVGDFALRARPLSAAVKQLLRPRRVSWSVG